MTTERKVLGKGLSALISTDAASLLQLDERNHEHMIYISIDDVEVNPYQPRSTMTSDELQELSDSIKEYGVLQPILVAKGKNKRYCIISGERRWRASIIAGLKTIPVIFKNCSDLMLLQIAILENIQREDLTPIEEAKAYQQLIDQFGYTQDLLAEKLNKSRSHIANMIRLLRLPQEVQGWVDQNQISVGHAKAIFTSDEPVEFAKQVIDRGLNVRETEQLARAKRVKKDSITVTRIKSPENIGSAPEEKDLDLLSLEEKMSNNLGCKTEIKLSGSSGSITLSFKTLEEFDILVYALCRQISDMS